MPARITLTVMRGPLDGREFVFEERDTCLMGRSKECGVHLPKGNDHRHISRHHCLLDINPPDVRIRDFGSLNGTYVNGKKIGARQKGQTREEAAQMNFPEHDLKEGDEIKLGQTVFRVGIFIPPACDTCGAEIPEDYRRNAEITPGYFRCGACRRKTQSLAPEARPDSGTKCCLRCGRDVRAEVGAQRAGNYVCSACRADPLQMIAHLLDLAKSGRKDLLAIQGYAIERKLAQGGMGAVFLARHERSGERVALKVMLPQVAANERGRAQFLREVENTRALAHPHVVELRDAGCSEGTFFFTLEFCEGGSVDQRIKKRGGRLSIDEALPIILQTLDGLNYAHHAEITQVKLADGGTGRGSGLVHRDLSTHNILLTTPDAAARAKVSDFGLAKAFDTAGLSGQTRTGSAAGKPLFMPRQQVLNFKYAKPDVDVWAAAACLYNMLTGRYPRDFVPNQEPWTLVLNTGAVPIRQRDPSIPRRLAEVIDAALADKPQIGFQTAADLKRALEGAL